MNIDIVILAAGKGTRMKSALPKVLHPIAKKSMLVHVLETVETLLQKHSGQQDAIHLVVGHGAQAVKDTVGSGYQYVEQREQLGTGHAVAQTLPALAKNSKTLVLYGDVPLTQLATLEAMLYATSDNEMAVLTTFLDDPTGYGRIVREKNGAVCAIVEEKDASEAEQAINEINTGILCVSSTQLKKWLPQLDNSNAQNEYYLTDIIAMAHNDGITINTPHPKHLFEVQGVNSRIQLAALERDYQAFCAEQLMVQGVTLADPARIDIRGKVSTGSDNFIDCNVILEGDVRIGNNVSIGPNTAIKNSVIGDNVEILENCVLEGATVEAACTIGPFARLRPGANLADKAKIGNFVEVKNSNIGVGSKVNHLSYVGDAEVGSGSNIGAGTITCNYDGANKFKTQLGEGVFVGSNSTLVAPLEIDDGAFIGAGSTVTKAVPADSLAIGRARQKVITGWEKPSKDKKKS